MRNRIKYSQNFLKSVELVRNLIGQSGVSENDTVIEIGAGEGIITSELLNKAKKVIAFELDKIFFDKLSQKFQNNRQLDLKNEDFLASPLPNYPYKVFSNIPFNITSAIIKKLTFGRNPPEDSYLIVQKEAAAKFAGKPQDSKNSQISVLLYPWFEFKVVYKFKPTDFFPKPSVEIILLEIKKRDNPLIDNKNKESYEDFITYAFNQPKPNVAKSLERIITINPTTLKPSELEFDNWLALFNVFLKIPKDRQNIVKGSFVKQQKDQEKIEKIHRTRVDKSWRKYRN
jgi:23S rRNA (adenine-N6)-dimethyltransferase